MVGEGHVQQVRGPLPGVRSQFCQSGAARARGDDPCSHASARMHIAFAHLVTPKRLLPGTSVIDVRAFPPSLEAARVNAQAAQLPVE